MRKFFGVLLLVFGVLSLMSTGVSTMKLEVDNPYKKVGFFVGGALFAILLLGGGLMLLQSKKRPRPPKLPWEEEWTMALEARDYPKGGCVSS